MIMLVTDTYRHDLACDAVTEDQHADHEGAAMDHLHPLAEAGQILLFGSNHERAEASSLWWWVL